MPKSVPGKSSTAVIYIGQKRYQELAKQAREISYLSESISGQAPFSSS
ncbi:Uncharacterised protein [Raoultella planticola]|nr:Uncharacterised protein [Raoultella planticola]